MSGVDPHSVDITDPDAGVTAGGAGDGWRDHVEFDPRFLRPLDAPVVVGDAGNSRRELGWAPTVTFIDLVARMLDDDMELLRRSGQ